MTVQIHGRGYRRMTGSSADNKGGVRWTSTTAKYECGAVCEGYNLDLPSQRDQGAWKNESSAREAPIQSHPLTQTANR